LLRNIIVDIRRLVSKFTLFNTYLSIICQKIVYRRYSNNLCYNSLTNTLTSNPYLTNYLNGNFLETLKVSRLGATWDVEIS